jgi:dolichol kinase
MTKLFYYRKIFHLFGSIVAVGYLIIPEKTLYLKILVGVLIPFLLVDIIRLTIPSMNKLFFRIFSRITAEKDTYQLNGSTYYLISSILAILLFPREIAIAAMLYLSLGDSIAAIIGKRFGKIKIYNKTLEGSLACFLLCFFISLTLFNWKIALVGALSATIVELFSSGDFRTLLLFDDNLLIPLLTGAALLLSMKIF